MDILDQDLMIQQELEQQTKEFIEMVDGMKKSDYCAEDHWHIGYMRAIDDILNKLNE